jgi:hypothetical protein
VGLVLYLGFIATALILLVLGLRWTRRPATARDLRKADDAQVGDGIDKPSMTDQAFSSMTKYDR